MHQVAKKLRNRKRGKEEKLKLQKCSIQKLWKKIKPQDESLKNQVESEVREETKNVSENENDVNQETTNVSENENEVNEEITNVFENDTSENNEEINHVSECLDSSLCINI